MTAQPDTDLAPFPAVSSGLLIGYARVSTKDQLLDRQIRALTTCGCSRIFSDKLSGKNTDRPELQQCFDYVRPGDLLVVTELSRLGRSLQDLLNLVGALRDRGVGFRSLKEQLDTSTPAGRLVFHVFAALAEFIRELIVENTNEGLAAARERGTTLGRPPALNADQIKAARHMLTAPGATVSGVARLLGVSRGTLYNRIPELKALSAGGPTQ